MITAFRWTDFPHCCPWMRILFIVSRPRMRLAILFTSGDVFRRAPVLFPISGVTFRLSSIFPSISIGLPEAPRPPGSSRDWSEPRVFTVATSKTPIILQISRSVVSQDTRPSPSVPNYTYNIDIHGRRLAVPLILSSIQFSEEDKYVFGPGSKYWIQNQKCSIRAGTFGTQVPNSSIWNIIDTLTAAHRNSAGTIFRADLETYFLGDAPSEPKSDLRDARRLTGAATVENLLSVSIRPK